MKAWETLKLLVENEQAKVTHPLLKKYGPIFTINAFLFNLNQGYLDNLMDGWEIVRETFGWDEALKRLNARKVVRCLDDDDVDMSMGGIKWYGEKRCRLTYANPASALRHLYSATVTPIWFTGRWEEVKG